MRMALLRSQDRSSPTGLPSPEAPPTRKVSSGYAWAAAATDVYAAAVQRVDGRVARDEERRKGGTRGETLEAALGGKVRRGGGERCENRLEFAVAKARGGCAGENWIGRGEEREGIEAQRLNFHIFKFFLDSLWFFFIYLLLCI